MLSNSEETSNKGLRQIYHALELRQYSKALKLSYIKPQCELPIAVALRAHCLERLGRNMECLSTLRDLIAALFPLSTVLWQGQIEEKIWALKMMGETFPTPDTTAGTSKIKGYETTKKICDTNHSPLTLMDILDSPRWKRQEILQPSSISTYESMVIVGGAEAVARETTIETIALCLRNLHLFETIVHLHMMASEAIVASNLLISVEKKDIHIRSLEQLFHSSLIVAHEYNLHDDSLLNVESMIHYKTGAIQAMERAQSASMQLVRHTGEKLYSYWSAHAILLHFDCVVSLCERLDSLSIDPQHKLKYDDLRQKLKLKSTMLPRLAETMLKNHIVSTTWDDGSKLYIKALQLLGKMNDVIHFLKEALEKPINSSQLVCDASRNHNLEKRTVLASIYIKMGRWDDAFNVYADHLVRIIPDQWEYWTRLLDCAMSSSSLHTDDAIQKCSMIVQSIIVETGDKPRALYLFMIELEFQRLERGASTDTEHLSVLITEYIQRFAEHLYCCFEDIRKYIRAIALPTYQNATDETILNASLVNMLSLSQTSFAYDSVSTSTMLKLCWLKVSLEVWYLLLSYHKNRVNEVDESIEPLIPSLDIIISNWRASLDSVNCSDDKGDCYPSDDFILLSVQILMHKASRTIDIQLRYATLVLATTLLELAIIQSSLNPYLKITAMNLYARFHDCPSRAFELYSTIGIKQIQYESCSYLILANILRGSNYVEVSEVCWNILSLHAKASKDASEYALKAYKRGNMEMGNEMLQWKQKMAKSLQLKEAKSLLLNTTFASAGGLICLSFDSASSDNTFHPDSLDKEWAIKLLKDCSNFHSPPSLLTCEAIDSTQQMDPISDHRDFTINQFEILYRFDYPSLADINELAHLRQLTHSILTRMVLLEHYTKPPKKGKLQHMTIDDPAVGCSQSILRFIDLGEKSMGRMITKIEHASFASCMFDIARASCLVCTGQTHVKEVDSVPIDSIQSRESACIILLENAGVHLTTLLNLMKSGKMDSDGVSSSSIVIDCIVPFFVSLMTVEKIFNMFGFGKSKAQVKVGGKALCKLAGDLLKIIEFISEKNRASAALDIESLLVTIETLPFNSILCHVKGKKHLDEVLGQITRNKLSSLHQSEVICSQIISVLSAFNASC